MLRSAKINCVTLRTLITVFFLGICASTSYAGGSSVLEVGSGELHFMKLYQSGIINPTPRLGRIFGPAPEHVTSLDLSYHARVLNGIELKTDIVGDFVKLAHEAQLPKYQTIVLLNPYTPSNLEVGGLSLQVGGKFDEVKLARLNQLLGAFDKTLLPDGRVIFIGSPANPSLASESIGVKRLPEDVKKYFEHRGESPAKAWSSRRGLLSEHSERAILARGFSVRSEVLRSCITGRTCTGKETGASLVRFLFRR